MRQWMSARNFWQYALAKGALYWMAVSTGGSAGGLAADIIGQHRASAPPFEFFAVLFPISMIVGYGDAKHREHKAITSEQDRQPYRAPHGGDDHRSPVAGLAVFLASSGPT